MEEKQKHKGRVFLLVGVIIAVFVVFALRLMKYQIVDAEKYREMAQGNYTSTQSIDAARGEMLDRYGRPLAVNQVSYDVMINEAYLPNKMRNTVIERIILLMESEGQSWIDTLPISTTEPFAFLTETESQKRQLEQIKTNNKINLDADVQTTLDNLFKISLSTTPARNAATAMKESCQRKKRTTSARNVEPPRNSLKPTTG